jgi:hypothetical protein
MGFVSFLAPEEGSKPTLSGELRQGEGGQRLSRTVVCVDRVGSIDDLSKGVVCMPLFPPPKLRHDRIRIGAKVKRARLHQNGQTSLADRRPRSG